MALPEVFVEVGTSLRATNVVLQVLDTTAFDAIQRQTVEDVKANSADVVLALEAFQAGTAQPALTGTVFPTPGIMEGSTAAIDKDLKRLDVVTAADLPAGRFAEFQALRTRIETLQASVASAALRKK